MLNKREKQQNPLQPLIEELQYLWDSVAGDAIACLSDTGAAEEVRDIMYNVAEQEDWFNTMSIAQQSAILAMAFPEGEYYGA